MNILIDGRKYQAEGNETILQVARRNKLLSIPSLCYHPALGAEGSCRLCVVEVAGEAELCTACTFKAREGVSVSTKTTLVIDSRRRTLRYLLQRAPDNQLLQQWGEEYGAEVPAGTAAVLLEGQALPNCLLCGFCVRVCRKLGLEALQFIGKGAGRHVQRPAVSGKTSCIGCQACERLCPSQAIHSEIIDSNMQWER